MWISNNAIFGLLLLMASGHVGELRADDLALNGGASLTGSVRLITKEGEVELVSELSPAPLVLKKGVVQKVTFSTPEVSSKPPSAVVELTNGDLLPATLEALDDQNLTVVSPAAGRVVIARAHVQSLQLGSPQLPMIYTGPRSLDEWTHNPDETKNWEFANDALIATGQARASKLVALPEQFVLQFVLKWQAKQNPNFQVFFADPLKPQGVFCDRYYLQFGGAGLEIKREASKGKRYHTLIQLNRIPNQYADHVLTVQLRVNRKAARMQLVLNGDIEGEFVDPIASVPNGSGIALVCNTPNGSPQEISQIEISELDDLKNRHHAEERGDPKIDSLISREDDRWGGHLIDIHKTDASTVFRFKSDFQSEMIEIPLVDVSTVFFGLKQGDAPPPAPAHSFVLRLCDKGFLSVSACQFVGDDVLADHPLLGRIHFSRQGVVAMEQSASHPPTRPKP